MLLWGFKNMSLNRVEAQIHPLNVASLKLAEAIGFRREGLLREVGYWGGGHHDLLQYSLLQRDWQTEQIAAKARLSLAEGDPGTCS